MKMPCKECLVKAICIQKIGKGGEMVTSLECSLLNKWLTTHNGSCSYGPNLRDAYKELRALKRSKEITEMMK